MVVAVQLAALLALLLTLWHLAWRPQAVARSFARQGVRGPPYTFLAGSLPEAKRLLMAGRRGVAPLDAGCHDIMPLILPPFHRWVADYGRTFVFWIGPIPAVLSTDLQVIKKVLTDRTGLYQKDFMIPALKFLFGNSVILINGDDWKRHRKVVLPAFNHETIKSMSAVTAEVTKQMMQQWREQIHGSGDKDEESAEIDMIHAFNDLTSKVNGRVAFGTSHREVEEVMLLMREMQKLATAATLDAPILWYLPTRRNLHVRRLNKQLRSKIMSIMLARLAADRTNKHGGRGGAGAGAGGGDLLGLLLEAWTPPLQLQLQHGNNGETLTTDEVIDECKTFFGAGQETTATLLVWAMFLLAVYPEWQDRVREEIVREFGCTSDADGGNGEVPHADVLAKLKLLYMVLMETSRLYPPIAYIQRRAASDAVLGGIKVPQGTVISIPIAMLHRDKEVWGPDADEFNPMRFEHGLTKAAKDPKALLSFSMGPRVCTGQRFGIVKAQVVMAMILRRFSFSLSPKYVHKPKYLLSLTPKLGMPLIVRSVDGSE